MTVEKAKADETMLAAGNHHGSIFYQHQRFCEPVRSGNGKPEIPLEDELWAVPTGEARREAERAGKAMELESLPGSA